MEQKEKEIKRNKRVGYFELVINTIVIFLFLFTLIICTCLNIYNGSQPSNMVILGTIGLSTIWIVNKFTSLEYAIRMYIDINLRLIYESNFYKPETDKGDS